VVDTVFPLRDAARAHEVLLEKNHVGKLVLEI
jgi:NADPH:quinone reductase-like Zn-dependent oxidoreductase